MNWIHDSKMCRKRWTTLHLKQLGKNLNSQLASDSNCFNMQSVQLFGGSECFPNLHGLRCKQKSEKAPTSSRFTVDHRQVLQVIDFSESLINDTSIEAEASILENEEDSQLSDGEQKITANLPPSEKWDVPCTQSKRMKCVSRTRDC
ncbi:hypothetical protein M513_00016 [Trichuris suis]|uniref:Uncharacterized protein n=1 Tax=Trichuris suis TaxID=68888 RepID=A0A085MNQ7_9BILA|nr:hypothetical protein M513_00016 [Trichuris suis]